MHLDGKYFEKAEDQKLEDSSQPKGPSRCPYAPQATCYVSTCFKSEV